MKYYGQNQEDKIIVEYFKGQESNINVLEIGSYDPFVFSNTRALVELGANCIYVEPSPHCFKKFEDEYLYKNDNSFYIPNKTDFLVYHIGNRYVKNEKQEDGNHLSWVERSNITLINAAVGNEDKMVIFYNSLGDAISSTSIEHKQKWEAGYKVKYEEITVQMISMNTLLSEDLILNNKIDFLNLDVESTNIELFNLIPNWFWERLKMLCIEHDNQQDYIISKLQPFGFKEIDRNAENLIMAK